MTNRARLPALVAAACLAACKGAPQGGTAVRLTPVEAFTDAGLDATPLVDRDTTTTLRIERPTRLTLRLGRLTAVRKVKVHGATALAISGARLGSFAPDGEGGWASADASGAASTLVTLSLAPTGGGASVAEVELWGSGTRHAGSDPATLARTATVAPAPASAGALRAPADDLLVAAAAPAAATLRPGVADVSCMRAHVTAGAG